MAPSREEKERRRKVAAERAQGARAAARAAFPLPVAELRALFDMLDKELGQRGCDHTNRLTRGWLERRGHDSDAVCAWLQVHGGYCDCEVLANVEEHVQEFS